MKTGMIAFLLAVAFLQTVPGKAQSLPGGCLIYTAAGQPVTYQGLAQLINRYDVIVFGEYHDNALLHQLEFQLLQAAFGRQPKLAVSLEMFERDVQSRLDDYLAGRSPEEEFLSLVRPWPNYRTDYRPLVEFAKANSLPVIAANIPRALAARYARTGELAGLTVEESAYLPQVHLAPPGQYRERFMDYLKGERASAMPVGDDKLENYYKAQCLKDDTMAESIADFHQRQPDYKIIHYQGDFHSRYRLGVVEKLQLLDPALRIAVITPVYVKDFGNLPKLLAEQGAAGDIVVILQ